MIASAPGLFYSPGDLYLASVFCGLSTEVHIFVAMRILQSRRRADGPRWSLAVLRTTPKHQLIKAIATLT